MTVKLYLQDPYMKKFDANVVRRGDGFVVLDKTAFYPKSGGQDYDTGVLNSVRVLRVERDGDDVLHYTDGMIGSDSVSGEINWNRRYSLMKMHTAQHMVSGIIAKRFKIKTNSVSIEESESAIKIAPLPVDTGVKVDITEDFRELVMKRIPLRFYELGRQEALKNLDPMRTSGIQKLPEVIKKLRVVEIPGIDKCACAGTHVKNTFELGQLEITRSEEKDNETTIYFRLI
ncbi:MAG: alanyl-tRNA editing protein [Candidatus Aenigmarchaeota archaeon]|nr:alanyl-tRNA editing protein [Candidatus Aenigmarchaeota archaeon]